MIRKASVTAVRVLINGAPIAEVMSRSHAAGVGGRHAGWEDRPEGIARDRWDVEIDTVEGTILIECGAIRERVSQELARAVFDAACAMLEQHHGVSVPEETRS